MTSHRSPENLSDHVALIITKILRFFADTFFSKRYGHRAVVLETVAAVPGMVGGMWIHLTCLRKMQSDRGWIKILLDEAENERMHLMTFIEIAQPKWYERLIILVAQAIFWNFYFILYVFFIIYIQKGRSYNSKQKLLFARSKLHTFRKLDLFHYSNSMFYCNLSP